VSVPFKRSRTRRGLAAEVTRIESSLPTASACGSIDAAVQIRRVRCELAWARATLAPFSIAAANHGIQNDSSAVRRDFLDGPSSPV
jgi:hypothetical protein